MLHLSTAAESVDSDYTDGLCSQTGVWRLVPGSSVRLGPLVGSGSHQRGTHQLLYVHVGISKWWFPLSLGLLESSNY